MQAIEGNLSQAVLHPHVSLVRSPRQGNLTELGRLLMQGSFSVWTEHKKGHAKVKDLARFKPMQRHLFLHEKALLFCKRREENGEGYEKAPSYSFKQSLSVSPPQELRALGVLLEGALTDANAPSG